MVNPKCCGIGAIAPRCCRMATLCSNLDIGKAVAILVNHRHERFVKQVMVHMMEEYAKTTDNDIDDMFVNMFREKINTEGNSPFPLDPHAL